VSDRATDFTGSIPAFYDRGLGRVFFADFADDIARRVVSSVPMRVLEIAAGTGIVTRRLRDLLPREVQLIATDLNAPMLEVAENFSRTKASSSNPPMPPPYRSRIPASMRSYANSGSCSFQTRIKAIVRPTGCWSVGVTTFSAFGTRTITTRSVV
jgi:SAM-dependent methyltransferase